MRSGTRRASGVSAAFAGGLLGTRLGIRWLRVGTLRCLLAAVLVVAGLKRLLT